MNYKIIVDSCCDLSPEYKKRHRITTVPLNLTMGEDSFVDDETLDLPNFMSRMKSFPGKIGSSAPSPVLYQHEFQGSQTSFAVTLSSNLSSSYSSAVLGKTMAEEECPDTDVHIFDSKSASAGQVLIVMKIRKMIEERANKTEIISTVENFI